MQKNNNNTLKYLRSLNQDLCSKFIPSMNSSRPLEPGACGAWRFPTAVIWSLGI